MKTKKKIQVEIKGWSGFSGEPITFNRWVLPSEYKTYASDVRKEGGKIKKTGKTKITKSLFNFKKR